MISAILENPEKLRLLDHIFILHKPCLNLLKLHNGKIIMGSIMSMKYADKLLTCHVLINIQMQISHRGYFMSLFYWIIVGCVKELAGQCFTTVF